MALEAAVELEPTARAPSRARSFTAAALHGWDLDDLTDLAELLVTELVTNAVVHAGSTIHLCVRLAPEAVRVEVQDSSSEEPRVEARGLTAEGGRGMQLVSELAGAHGTEQVGDDGKIVWFELPADT
jgi:anti-sigma regulatory factor (Ser/Thr protein kinase)